MSFYLNVSDLGVMLLHTDLRCLEKLIAEIIASVVVIQLSMLGVSDYGSGIRISLHIYVSTNCVEIRFYLDVYINVFVVVITLDCHITTQVNR
jgi:hypothetical protein